MICGSSYVVGLVWLGLCGWACAVGLVRLDWFGCVCVVGLVRLGWSGWAYTTSHHLTPVTRDTSHFTPPHTTCNHHLAPPLTTYHHLTPPHTTCNHHITPFFVATRFQLLLHSERCIPLHSWILRCLIAFYFSMRYHIH